MRRSGATTARAAPAPRSRPRSSNSRAFRGKIPATSPHAVTVPGAIEAWEAILKAHGRFGLDRALQPAIRYAEDGFAIAPRVASDWATMIDKLKPHAGSRNTIWSTAAAPGDRQRAAPAGARRDLAGDRGRRREGVLPGRDRRRHRRDGPGGRRLAGGGGSRAPPRRRRDADQHELSRARRGRTAAERAGADRAGAAQHPGTVRSRQARSDGAGAAASRARSRAARVRRARHAHRRSRPHARAGRRPARQGLCEKAQPAPRSGQARAAAAGAEARLATRSISRWSTATAWRSR